MDISILCVFCATILKAHVHDIVWIGPVPVCNVETRYHKTQKANSLWAVTEQEPCQVQNCTKLMMIQDAEWFFVHPVLLFLFFLFRDMTQVKQRWIRKLRYPRPQSWSDVKIQWCICLAVWTHSAVENAWQTQVGILLKALCQPAVLYRKKLERNYLERIPLLYLPGWRHSGKWYSASVLVVMPLLF